MHLMIFVNLKKNMTKNLFVPINRKSQEISCQLALFTDKIELPDASINPPVVSTITTTTKPFNYFLSIKQTVTKFAYNLWENIAREIFIIYCTVIT